MEKEWKMPYNYKFVEKGIKRSLKTKKPQNKQKTYEKATKQTKNMQDFSHSQHCAFFMCELAVNF